MHDDLPDIDALSLPRASIDCELSSHPPHYQDSPKLICRILNNAPLTQNRWTVGLVEEKERKPPIYKHMQLSNNCPPAVQFGQLASHQIGPFLEGRTFTLATSSWSKN